MTWSTCCSRGNISEKMDHNKSSFGRLWKTLDAQRQEIRLLRVNCQQEKSLRCDLETHSLLDLSETFTRFMLERSGDDLDGVNVIQALRNAYTRQRWAERQRLHSFDAVQRISSHRPGASLHRFKWGGYACLSYVWGSSAKTCTIVVNGQAVEVTENLALALEHFRRDGMFCHQFLLWVDALCINQQDDQERAKEVQRMKDIYGTAWTVEAWLGPASFNSDAGLQLLRDMAAFKRADAEYELEQCIRRDPLFLGNTGWLGLQNIMDRSYWYRLWIIQEVVLGGPSVWVWCGHSMIDWETFCDGVATLQEFLWLVKDLSLNVDVHMSKGQPHAWKTISLHLVYQDLSRLSKVPLENRPEHAYGRLLDLSIAARCSDSRDKVYALLALFPEAVSQRIRPDYAASLSTVFTHATQAFIMAYQNLEPLREGNPWGPSKCPSWVADWQWQGRIRYCRIEHQLWGPTYLFPRSDEDDVFVPYRASGDIGANFSFDTHGLVLTCTGFIMDRITGLSAAADGYFNWALDTEARPASWQSAYGGFRATREALMRTLLMDRVRFGKKPSRRHRAVLHLPATFDQAHSQFDSRGWTWLAGQEGYYFRWERFRDAMTGFPLGEWTFDEFFSNEVPEDAIEYDFTEVYAATERSVKKRRFMTTEKGFMGWAPDNMWRDSPTKQCRVGDIIAIVHGCSTPLLIREVEECYHVLGEAYVQGIMDGEALQQQTRTQTLAFI